MSAVNGALAEAVRSAHERLAGRDDGHLPRPARLAVFDALGREASVEAAAALVRLALPRWDAIRPNDERPDGFVRAATTARVEIRDARARSLAFHREVEELFGTIPDDAGFAAWAASALVDVAALGVEDSVPDDADDDDLDFDARAPEHLAELALTGDDPAANVEDRRALWQWWLDEAVPAAAQAGPRPGRSSTG